MKLFKSLLLTLSLSTTASAADAAKTCVDLFHAENYIEAVPICTDLASKGDTYAQFYLGFMSHYGKGVSQDYKEAVYRYTKAADQGVAIAQHNLGVMFKRGNEVR
jgi:TPR repeat protein